MELGLLVKSFWWFRPSSSCLSWYKEWSPEELLYWATGKVEVLDLLFIYNVSFLVKDYTLCNSNLKICSFPSSSF